MALWRTSLLRRAAVEDWDVIGLGDSMDLDELHDLAGRLLDREEPDAAELLAHQARFDQELLFSASDEARARGQGLPRRRQEWWEAVSSLLTEAAVVALRQQAYGADLSDVTEQQAPGVPTVTVDLDFAIEQLDGSKDPFELVEVLLKMAHSALMIAGQREVWHSLRDAVTAVAETEGPTAGDYINVIEDHVNLSGAD